MAVKSRLLNWALIFVITLGFASARTQPVEATGSGEWTSIGPQGGSIPALAIDPQSPMTVYAGTAAGVYKSTDGGSTWAHSGLPSYWVYALAVDPLTPSTIYAGTRGKGVYKSLDGGATWFQANKGIEDQVVYALVINPLNTNTLYNGSRSISSGKGAELDEWDPAAYLATHSPAMENDAIDGVTWGGGVFRSLDGGLSWTKHNNGLIEDLVYGLAIDPKNTSIMYAGTHTQGVSKSWNYGETWLKTGPGMNNGQVRSLVVDPHNSGNILAATWHGGIYQSLDGGNNWSNNPLPTTKVRFLASGKDAVYAGLWGDGIYKSTNRGVSFSSANNGLVNYFVNTVAINPLDNKIAFAGFDGGAVFKTTNGSSWSSSAQGLNVTRVKSLVFDPTSPTILDAGTQGDGVFKSLDSGLNWTGIDYGLGNYYVNSVVVNPLDSFTVYAATDGGVFRTKDGGATWTWLNRGLAATGVLSLSLFPANPPILYAGTLGKDVYLSTNGGDIWNPVPIDRETASLQINSVLVDPRSPATVYAGTEELGVFKSVDFGAHWLVLDVGMGRPAVKAIVFKPGQPDMVYAGTSLGIYKSTMGGLSWSSLAIGPIQVNSIWVDAAAPATVYAGLNGGGVYRKSDGNGFWHGLNTGLVNMYINSLVMAPDDSSKLYAGTGGGGAYVLAVDNTVLPFKLFLPAILAGNSLTERIMK
jgi:photosystem II stability/assembly factor-like uncharacterized protein